MSELKTIARKDVEEQFTSKLSLMPEDLEKQLRPAVSLRTPFVTSKLKR